jgi:lactoylglutathione lyase
VLTRLLACTALRAGASAPHEPGSDAAHAALWSNPGVTLELTHNWGTESQPEFAHHAGNAERDGFGHIAFAVADLDAACARLDAAGVRFKKRPAEGRMRSIAFVYDPDGYWVEIVERAPRVAPGAPDSALEAPYFTFAQTMLRVKDPKPSLEFYTRRLGMTLLRATHADTFSIYFLATLPQGSVVPDPSSPEAREFVKAELYPRRVPILELTHNHGTEADAAFAHFNGNEEGRRGFGHVGFLVADVYATTAELQAHGVAFHKLPDAGAMKGLAFAKDPDGYLVELIKRGQDGKF